MKTLLSIVSGLAVLCLFGMQTSSAYQPLLDFYNNSDLVLVGKIISLYQVPTTTSSPSQYPNQTRYDIQVEQYYKNPQQAKLVTVYGYAKGIYFSSDPTYDVGDRVFLYLHKENLYYQIQPHSLKLNNNCDARAMIPMATLPFEPPPISSAAGGYDFYPSDSKGNFEEFFVKGNNVTINFNEQNGLPVVKSATVELIVKTNNGTTTVMDDKKSLIVSACNGQIPMRWTFTPDIRGQYSAEINVTGYYELGREPISFSEPIPNTGFTVLENSGGPVIEKSPIISPLKQFKSGIATKDIQCKQGLTLVMKAKDGSPACVRPESVSKLLIRGWAMLTLKDFGYNPGRGPVISATINDTGKPLANQDNQTSSALRLYLSTDSTYANPAEAVGVDISLNNTSSTSLVLAKSDNWPRSDLSSGLCSNLPFGMAILKGYYTEQNMTGASSLVIYGTVPCPLPPLIKIYKFQPLSSKATQVCDSLFSCPELSDMKIHLKIDGFMDSNGQHRPFNVGTYTIVGGDEWGHLVIQHFIEAYATAYAEVK